MSNSKSYQAFTLVEMLIVIIIMIILMGIMLLGGQAIIERANQLALQANLRDFDLALQQYYADNGNYPNGPVNARTPSGLMDTGGLLAEYIEFPLYKPRRSTTLYYVVGDGTVANGAPGGDDTAYAACISYGGKRDADGKGGYCISNRSDNFKTGKKDAAFLEAPLERSCSRGGAVRGSDYDSTSKAWTSR